MKPAEIARMHDVIDQHGVRDGDLTSAMFAKIANTLPARLSAVRAIVAGYEDEQSKIDAAARAEEVERQRAEEDAQARVVSLRRNCSLDEWKDIGDDERNMLLTPLQSEGGAFNKQDNDAIEWAQWSWNPVTGCKHDCPYCYARDIALSQRMAKVYPNGFAPTFRSNALNAPARTKVPKDAAADTRHRNVFTCSMADLFGRWVPAEWIDAVLGTVRDSAEWNFLFLTKFPQRMKEFDIPDNAWMGATVDMQARVKNAENAFENVGGKVRWLSVEPLIEPLRFERLDLFDWLVIGGASSSTQTPAWHPPYRWIEDLVRQADAAGVPVYMKSNLGIANRVLDLPFDAPIKRDPQQAPNEFRYLGNT
jgi:protein gp37